MVTVTTRASRGINRACRFFVLETPVALTWQETHH